MEIRLLRSDEIECRIGTINEKGLSLLLYKDARADMKILDETFGVFGWKRTHQSIDGNLYCTVEIWDSEKQSWIAKQDVGKLVSGVNFIQHRSFGCQLKSVKSREEMIS